MKFDILDGDFGEVTESDSIRKLNRKIKLVPLSIAQSLRDLSQRKPVSAADLIREARSRMIGRLLIRAGDAAEYSIPYTSVLLGVTERTVRNWIAESGLAPLFMGAKRAMRMQYRGMVTDLSGRVATLYTPWCDSYGAAIRKSKLLSYSYRIMAKKIEVEISENLSEI